jgi:serpin B
MRSELEALGMSDPFVLGTADFSGMTSEQVAIKDVFHQATIKVAEEGTVATAVTAVVINSKSAPPQAPHAVTFDRPFLFAISDRSTGALLFLGRVVDPTAQ